MRFRVLMALLGLGMALLMFSGCGGNNETGFTVSGTAVNAVTDTPAAGVSLTLLTDGIPFRTDITLEDGAFDFRNVPNGAYTMRATSIDGGPASTLFGPITVADAPLTGVTARVATLTQLGFTNPVNNTATLLAFGTDAAGDPIEVTAAAGTLLTDLAGNPAVLPNIPQGTRDVAVANPATDESVTFRNVSFLPNTVVVVRARFTTQAMGVSFGGAVLDFPANTPVPGASVQLLRNGAPVGSTVTTSAAGAFTLADVAPAADYTLRIASPTGAFPTTYYRPVSILETTSGNVFEVATDAALGVTPPTDGTAALVAFGLNAVDDVELVTVTLDSGMPTTEDAPVLLGLIDPGVHAVTVTGTDEGAGAVTFANVNLAANTVTVFRATVE